MARYTLTLSPDYVKNWTIKDAIREFIQNAIDQESLDEANKKNIEVIGGTLYIANATSILTKKSLLLGGGTKKEGDSNIGQFGEGYKVGLLVLLREGFNIEICNYGAGELWIPKIVKSRIYDSEVLAIDTQEYDFGDNIRHSLEIKISKDTFDFKQVLREVWLGFDTTFDKILPTPKCNILLDEQFKGNIYVKGLYIGNLEELTYGYDFEPSMIKIGRDRNLVNSFDIIWTLGRNIWNTVDYSQEWVKSIIKDLVLNKAKDLEYIEIDRWDNSIIEYLAQDYKDKYVITNERDKQAIIDTYGKVDMEVVPEVIKKATYSYQASMPSFTRVKAKSAEDLLDEFLEKYEEVLTSDMIDELNEIKHRLF